MKGGVDQGRDSDEVFPCRKWTKDVLNFGKYAGRRFAEVYIKDASYAEWAQGLDKIKMWKLLQVFPEEVVGADKGGDKSNVVGGNGLRRDEGGGGV